MSQDRLIELIYAAAEEPAEWNTFLEAFTAAMHTTLGALWISPADPRLARISASCGLAPELAALTASPEYRDPWVSRVDLSSVPVGKILRSNEICSDEILDQDEWYQRLCVPADLHFGGGVMLEISETMFAGMATNRSRRSGPLTDEEIEFWSGLLSHLKRAVRMTGQRMKLATERDALQRYFNDLGQGLILATVYGVVAAANERARAILAQENGLSVSRSILQAANPDSNRDLTAALLATGTVVSPEPVQLPIIRQGQRPLIANIVPIRNPNEPQASVDVPSALIHLADPAQSLDLDPAPLRRLYAMTAAEARLCCLLAAGSSLAQAAELSHVSMNTIRTHMQRALTKAGLNRQSQLVALTLSVSHPLTSSSKSSKLVTTKSRRER